MLMIVDKETKMILARFEAWAQDCMERAEAFIRDGGYKYIDDEITFSGDMVIWVH